MQNELIPSDLSNTEYRALLVLAAKASGIDLIRWNATYACYETNQGLWNHWLNDGDALRLAVEHKARIEFHDYGGSAFINSNAHGYCEDIEAGPCAATRRAIVIAVAAVGRSML